MPTYRRRPTNVEARQFKGWENAFELCEWADAYYVPPGYEHRLRKPQELDRSRGDVLDDAPGFLVIRSLRVRIRVDVLDWILRIEDEWHCCKREVFAEEFELVEDGAS